MIDLTERGDFSGTQDDLTTSYLVRLRKSDIFPRWTEGCLFKPNEILIEAGVRTFSDPQEVFPPADRCDCCGRLIPPWRKTQLCKECMGSFEVSANPLRKEKMISNPADLYR